MFNLGQFPTEFHQKLRCYKVDENNDRNQLNYGGKVLSNLAESSLMMFQLENLANGMRVCVGVLEFTAEEGTIILPSWMYKQLGIERHANLVDITPANPELGYYAKFQPMSFDFLDIENPKVILEKALRNYTCINTNDCIEISHCNKIYQLMVKQTKPGDSICVINCNLMVEFEPAPGYDEYQERINMNQCVLNIQSKIDKYIEDTQSSQFQPFQGSSSRLDGKKKRKPRADASSKIRAPVSSQHDDNIVELKGSSIDEGYPDYDWKIGKLTFDRYFHKRVQQQIDGKKKKEEESQNKPMFPGKGNMMP